MMMYRSASKLSSPQRQSNTNQGPDLDSPSRHKIKLLADKWNHIQSGIEKDKFDKKEILEERVEIIEQHIAKEKPRDDQRFKILKEQVIQLQDFVVVEQHERQNFDAKRDVNLNTFQENLTNAFEQERNSKYSNDGKLLKQVDDRFIVLSVTTTRNVHQYDDRTNVKLNEVRSQTSILQNQIEAERRQREESAESLSFQIEGEINKFQDQLLIEKKVREETQSKIFHMIEDTHQRLQQDIQSEKRERQSTVDALLKLLEDACIKIDKNFRL